MSIQDQVFGMSGAAREVLDKLFVFGPCLDGNIPSKAGRSELIQLGHSAYYNGWNWLTEQGVKYAVDVLLLERKKDRMLDERSEAVHHHRHCPAAGGSLKERLTRAMISTSDAVTRNDLREIVNSLP